MLCQNGVINATLLCKGGCAASADSGALDAQALTLDGVYRSWRHEYVQKLQCQTHTIAGKGPVTEALLGPAGIFGDVWGDAPGAASRPCAKTTIRALAAPPVAPLRVGVGNVDESNPVHRAIVQGAAVITYDKIVKDAVAFARAATGKDMPEAVIKLKVGGSGGGKHTIFQRMLKQASHPKGVLGWGAKKPVSKGKGGGASEQPTPPGIAVGFTLLAGGIKGSQTAEHSCERVVREALERSHPSTELFDLFGADGGGLEVSGQGVLVDSERIVVTDVEKLEKVHRGLRHEWCSVVGKYGTGAFMVGNTKTSNHDKITMRAVRGIGQRWGAACAQLAAAKSRAVQQAGVGSAAVQDPESCVEEWDPTPDHLALHSGVCYMIAVVSRADYETYFGGLPKLGD